MIFIWLTRSIVNLFMFLFVIGLALILIDTLWAFALGVVVGAIIYEGLHNKSGV